MPHITGAVYSQGPPHHLRAGVQLPGPRFLKATVVLARLDRGYGPNCVLRLAYSVRPWVAETGAPE
jgi:hypothetical protein